MTENVRQLLATSPVHFAPAWPDARARLLLWATSCGGGLWEPYAGLQARLNKTHPILWCRTLNLSPSPNMAVHSSRNSTAISAHLDGSSLCGVRVRGAGWRCRLLWVARVRAARVVSRVLEWYSAELSPARTNSRQPCRAARPADSKTICGAHSKACFWPSKLAILRARRP